ncbi:hypothetical protein V3851_19735 [Paenibacillus sp. M1]|uniref:DUF559 domain-containing protein n=1 Tax=Paenibacillus haidiansis TaxID=1574488 RepID=A0ABU7VWB7_9BACL
MNGKFETAYEAFVKSHFCGEAEERKTPHARGRGRKNLIFLRNVWWPLFKSLEYLCPEFEVRDWCGEPFSVDFAYLPGQVKYAIEVKRFVPDVQEDGRSHFSCGLSRELYLQTLGFRVISFAEDDVINRPELCRYLLQMLICRYQAKPQSAETPLFAEMEVVRLALCSSRPLHPGEVAHHLNTDEGTAVSMMQALCTKGWLRPTRVGFGDKTLHYELVRNGIEKGTIGSELTRSGKRQEVDDRGEMVFKLDRVVEIAAGPMYSAQNKPADYGVSLHGDSMQQK